MTTWESLDRMMAECDASIAKRPPNPVLGSGRPEPALSHGERLLLAIGLDVFAIRSSREYARAASLAAPVPRLSRRSSRTWSSRSFTSRAFVDLGVV